MPSRHAASAALSFRDVFVFVAGYWRQQPIRLAVILFVLITAALLETNLPNTLSALLGAIRQQEDHDSILGYLFVFLGNYLALTTFNGVASLVYNVFETHIFKALLDDAFAHVERFLINNFAGSLIARISRGRTQIEAFEDQIITRILPTLVVLTGSVIFLAWRFPLLGGLLGVYIVVLLSVSWQLVTRFSGPETAAAALAQDTFSATLADGISGLATTKAFAQESQEIIRMRGITEMLRSKTARAYVFGNIGGLVQRLMLAGMLALMLGGGTWYLFHGRATIESMAYLALAYTIMSKLRAGSRR